MIPKYFFSLFESVQRIEEYLNIKYDELGLDKEEAQSLVELSKEVLIVTPQRSEIKGVQISNQDRNDDLDISEVLKQLCLTLQSDWRTNNVLTAGCVSVHTMSKTVLKQKFSNTLINEMISKKPWSVLLKSIGKQAFCTMLTDKIVLCRLPNGLYYQLAGPTISDKMYQTTTFPKSKSKPRKKELNNYYSTFLEDLTSRKSDLAHYLDTLLYNKKRRSIDHDRQPNKIIKLSRRQKKRLRSKGEGIVPQKCKKDIHVPVTTIQRMDLFYCANTINSEKGTLSIKLPKEHIFQESKSIEMRKNRIDFCLSKIFPKEFTTPNKRRKFYKRFTSIIRIVRLIETKHNNTHFLSILDKYCPRKDSDVAISDAATTHSQVLAFIHHIMETTFPIKFWGSLDNLHIIYRALKYFVTRRKFEKLSMTEILYQFKISSCQWLSKKSKTSRPVPSDIRKKEIVIAQALEWLFKDHISLILKSIFYITEHAKHGKEVFYFRRDVWQKITQPRVNSLIQSNYYSQIHNHDELSSLEIGAGHIRFIPKDNGLRMITNMRHTSKYLENISGNKQIADAKEILRPVLNVLKFEKENNPDLTGSSVLGRYLFYKRFKEYKQKMAITGSKKFYFVKVDITDCFDNIDQNKLLSILNGIFKNNEYISRSVHNIRPFSNKIVTRQFTAAGSSDCMDSLRDYSEKLKGIRPGSIQIDQNSYYITRADELRKLLKECISQSSIKIGNNYYKRQHGIAQGSSLSTLLCSFFFGQLEKEKLSFLKQDTEGALFIYVDDFLYITKNATYAKRFLDTMTRGITDFGAVINKEKCVSNLENDIKEFPWLGFNFNTKSLDVTIDTSGRQRSAVVSNLTVNYCQDFYTALLNCGVRAIKSKFYDILMDSEINSKGTLLRNLYDNFSFAAIKIEAQATEIARSAVGFVNEKCILEIIIRLGQIIIPLAPHGISKNEILSILFYSFHKVFCKRQSRYPNLTRYLQSVLKKYNMPAKTKINV